MFDFILNGSLSTLGDPICTDISALKNKANFSLHPYDRTLSKNQGEGLFYFFFPFLTKIHKTLFLKDSTNYRLL